MGKIKDVCAICGVEVTEGYTTIDYDTNDEDWGCVCEDCFRKLRYKSKITDMYDKLVNREQGYGFISKNGIPYSVLEGMTVGAEKTYTSDILFIMCESAIQRFEDLFVGCFMGAYMLRDGSKHYLKEVEETVREYVDEYESKILKDDSDIQKGD